MSLKPYGFNKAALIRRLRISFTGCILAFESPLSKAKSYMGEAVLTLSKSARAHCKFQSVLLFCLTTVLLVGLQIKSAGWFCMLLGLFSLTLLDREFARNTLLLYACLAILAITPINTDLSTQHIGIMGMSLVSVVVGPYFILCYAYKQRFLQLKLHFKRRWSKQEWGYLVLIVVLAYWGLSFYFKTTNAFYNWSFTLTPDSITRLLFGLLAVGIWDELFFISIVLGLLRKHIPFRYANIAQGILFTSFLFELGFTYWAPLVLYPFALVQGYFFKITESLFYVILVHVSVDLILFLALIKAHYPDSLLACLLLT